MYFWGLKCIDASRLNVKDAHSHHSGNNTLTLIKMVRSKVLLDLVGLHQVDWYLYCVFRLSQNI